MKSVSTSGPFSKPVAIALILAAAVETEHAQAMQEASPKHWAISSLDYSFLLFSDPSPVSLQPLRQIVLAA